MRIRNAESADGHALYEICLRTGADGGDATGTYAHPRLLGEVWVGPYLRFEPSLAFVLEDDGGEVVGYVLGARHTAAFEAACERSWWPELRARYPLDAFPPDSPDAAVVRRIHAPPSTPADIVSPFPAHLHIDLLPAAQGGGNGRRLLETLFAELVRAGAGGVHLGVSRSNVRAVGFYRRMGFGVLQDLPGAHWMGRRLDASTTLADGA